jgi:hypothetical protein
MRAHLNPAPWLLLDSSFYDVVDAVLKLTDEIEINSSVIHFPHLFAIDTNLHKLLLLHDVSDVIAPIGLVNRNRTKLIPALV